ncbi:MAG: hypothetical protein LBQ30_05550 [Treponema sp.]|jgi:hypothetical protein|nr:hypothetical protein [Treponema sp.]
MLSSSPRIHKTIPEEYRPIAEALFPSAGFQPEQGPSIEAAKAFAGILGIATDYTRLLTGADTLPVEQREHYALPHFLTHFQNNLDLLIQKTWVEKADEGYKERLQDRIPPFIATIEQGQYQEALADFSRILEELAYLFFGSQSYKEDFTEYTFRIDTQMGLFWWYGGQIGSLQQLNQDRPVDPECLRAILLIGLCYLTNF